MSELIKRTFHVEISSDVLEMIREVEQPFFSSGGAYYRLEKYLCEQDHPDARFFLNDPTICEYEKLLKENGRKYDSYVRKELNKAYKQRNLKRTELRRESELLTKKWRLYQKTASEATHLTKKQRSKLRMEPGGAEDMRLKKNAINNLMHEIEQPIIDYAEEHFRAPDVHTALKPLFAREYWIHTYVSYLPPMYLNDRVYSIVSEETVKQSPPEQLPAESHNPVQWKSRNRGGKVTLSGKGFDQVAAKHYPPNIPNQA